MNKIFNSLASAEYAKSIRSVDVKFKGYGTPSLYYMTMDIAMNISLVYQTNQWLLAKTHFNDMNLESFVKFIARWSKDACKLYNEHNASQDCRVAFLTSKDACSYLHYKGINAHLDTSSFLTLKVFADRREAASFLAEGKQPKLVS